VLGGVAVGRGFEPQSDLELSLAKILLLLEYILDILLYANYSAFAKKIISMEHIMHKYFIQNSNEYAVTAAWIHHTRGSVYIS
jgi:hypothetical protein